jgi:hypothetical protein
MKLKYFLSIPLIIPKNCKLICSEYNLKWEKDTKTNLVTLVWLVVPVWNPIALSISSRLGSSQVVEAWWYTKPGPFP